MITVQRKRDESISPEQEELIKNFLQMLYDSCHENPFSWVFVADMGNNTMAFAGGVPEGVTRNQAEFVIKATRALADGVRKNNDAE